MKKNQNINYTGSSLKKLLLPMRDKLLGLLITIAIYGGIAFLIILALSPVLLVIFSQDDSIPGPYGPCNPEYDDCGP